MVRTSTIFDPLASRLMPSIGADALYELQVTLRRSVHVLEYAILFVGLSLGPLRGRPVTAFLACVAVALLDEGLQALNPARSGKISDVAEDSSGAAIALLIATPYWGRLREMRMLARNRARR